MEEEPPTPPTPAQPTSPFWLPSTSTRGHTFRPNFALILNTGFFVILLFVSAIAFLAILTPSLLSFIQHVFRPTSIKRGWDSLNLFLVLFAVLCGFLGRKEAAIDDEQTSKHETPRSLRSQQSSNWYPYGHQGNVVQIRRSFKSYPDLRQEILWENDRTPRYFDDTCVGNYNSPRLTTSAQSFRSHKVEGGLQNASLVKKIEVSDLQMHKSEDSTPQPSPSSAPPAPLEPSVPDLSTGAEESKQEYQSIRRRGRKTRRSAAKDAESPPPSRRTSSPPPPPPSPPVPEVVQQDSEGEGARSTRKKRGGMAKEIISSIYHQSKRKKNQRRRSHDNLEEFVHPPNPNPSFLPPPPPPLPPPSIFHALFSSKKGKSVTKTSSAPSPPPPPRRRSSASHAVLNSTKAKARFKPPAATNLNLTNQVGGDRSESPLIPIPPPPPPLPFKFRAWKFAVEGDYVKISSSPKSGGESEMDESDASTPMADGKGHPSFSCPSPDVNHKADDFIAMFRAKLELEKMNSIRQKQGIGFSPLGPDYSPTPSPT